MKHCLKLGLWEYLLSTWTYFLPISIPLEFHRWVSQLHWKSYSTSFIHLICRIQNLSKSCWVIKMLKWRHTDRKYVESHTLSWNFTMSKGAFILLFNVDCKIPIPPLSRWHSPSYHRLPTLSSPSIQISSHSILEHPWHETIQTDVRESVGRQWFGRDCHMDISELMEIAIRMSPEKYGITSHSA